MRDGEGEYKEIIRYTERKAERATEGKEDKEER